MFWKFDILFQHRWGHGKRERKHRKKSPGRQDSTDYAADLSSDHSTPSTQSPARHIFSTRTGSFWIFLQPKIVALFCSFEINGKSALAQIKDIWKQIQLIIIGAHIRQNYCNFCCCRYGYRKIYFTTSELITNWCRSSGDFWNIYSPNLQMQAAVLINLSRNILNNKQIIKVLFRFNYSSPIHVPGFDCE